jgi:Asp-tRNA(Asn)/Glu-tRNA(Gln) amidotransferase C subunit
MSVTIETEEPTFNSNTDASEQLRSGMAAVRVVFTWLGTTKTLSHHQKAVAAGAFDADGTAISASKKLLNSKHPAFAAVTKIKGNATKYWKESSLPFPEPGLRLIGRQRIGEFDIRMIEFNQELREAVQELETHYGEMRMAAKRRLGSLFNSSDYPATLVGAFAIEHSFPSVEVPEYLQQLNPAVYRQECERVQTQFSDAVAMAEQMFHEQLKELVEHLVERLSDNDGKAKTFRDSTITNITDFFGRFRQLRIGSNEELEQLVELAQSIVGGLEPQRLRDNQTLRQQIASQMANVKSSLDGLVIDRPRRNIIRKAR